MGNCRENCARRSICFPCSCCVQRQEKEILCTGMWHCPNSKRPPQQNDYIRTVQQIIRTMTRFNSQGNKRNQSGHETCQTW
eukprot:2221716-Amphidinium_carterae.1